MQLDEFGRLASNGRDEEKLASFKKSLYDRFVEKAPKNEDGVIDPNFFADQISSGVNALFGGKGPFETSNTSPDVVVDILLDYIFELKDGLEEKPSMMIVSKMLDRLQLKDVAANYILDILMNLRS